LLCFLVQLKRQFLFDIRFNLHKHIMELIKLVRLILVNIEVLDELGKLQFFFSVDCVPFAKDAVNEARLADSVPVREFIVVVQINFALEFR